MFFFFSSRRRHTRFDCDWSSDVCSSDLMTVASRRPHAADAVPMAAGPVPRVRLSARLPVPHDARRDGRRSEEHTSELQSQSNLVCRLLLEKKKNNQQEKLDDHGNPLNHMTT